ncbi:MAG: glutamate racemase [Bacteroidia bacterium]|nr:glutamate racemase [Bacteroidia bacterium]MCX7651376.1 glutamate racemase [Bacteroidia bacterium]MDW8416724.1 glutamate racemase [Bacteroidia bacterium]
MPKVGIFDSGLGGLLTARLLREKRPDISILYYGDTAHLPYGDKSSSQIRTYVRDIVRFLRAQGAEIIAIACNTASAVGYDTACEAAENIPVLSAIYPALNAFSELRFSEPVGVIGTYTTIRSGIYGRALKAMGYRVRELATPVLVPLIEEGWIEHPATAAAIHTYLSELGEVETLLLACTHYPLLQNQMQKYYTQVGMEVHIVSTAELLAEAVARAVGQEGTVHGESHFWVSDANPRFIELAKRFWGADIILEEAPAGTSTEYLPSQVLPVK